MPTILTAFHVDPPHPFRQDFLKAAVAQLYSGRIPYTDVQRILATCSHLFPDSYRIMGWDVADKGFRLVLSPKLPELIRTEMGPLVDSFLLSQDLSRRDIVHYFTHPGGAKVIDAIGEALGLANGELRLSEEVLADHGNVSSASVLTVLERWLANGGRTEPGYGLLSAFGPGFSAELVLLQA